ncbi:hypothetical protein ACOMHN_001842 [Nucella lapillus]
MATFEPWKSSICPIRPFEFARKGFFATGNEDEVECFRCGGRHSQWQQNERDIRAIHEQISPHCPFVLHNGDDYNGGPFIPNIPVPHDENPSVIPETGQEEEICLNRQRLAPGVGIHIRNVSAGRPATQKIYLFPKLSWDDRRRKTFGGFPRTRKQLIPGLVRHGFFYLGFDDSVICFSCGLSLNTWQPQDDPRIAHMQWRPECAHVRSVEDTVLTQMMGMEMTVIGADGGN